MITLGKIIRLRDEWILQRWEFTKEQKKLVNENHHVNSFNLPMAQQPSCIVPNIPLLLDNKVHLTLCMQIQDRNKS